MATTTINLNFDKYPKWKSDALGGVYAIDDLTNFDGLTYRNITGVNSNTSPNTDTTNWVLDLSRAKIFVGRNGVFDPLAETKTRDWDAITNLPTTPADLLQLTGHTILGIADDSSVVITGGDDNYYCQVGQTTPLDNDGQLSETNGGDNRNLHLAGIIKAFHADLLKDDNGIGSHGGIFGGSWKQVTGDYGGSFVGQYHQVNGNHSVAVGGFRVKIGDISDATLVRYGFVGGGELVEMYNSLRSAILGGLRVKIDSSVQSGILGGTDNTINGGDISAIIGSQNSTITGNESAVLAGRSHEITSRGGIAHGSITTNNITNSRTHGGGQNVSGKICQTYEVALRRRTTLTVDTISPDAGAGNSLITPPANSIVTIELNISALRSDVIGDYASFKLRGVATTIGGSLIILSQSTTVDNKTDLAYDCSLNVSGANLRIRINQAASQTNNWIGHGTVMIQAI